MSDSLAKINSQLAISRRDTVLEHDYRSDTHKNYTDELLNKPRVAINNDTEEEDSDDDEEIRVAKRALYAREQGKRNTMAHSDSDFESEDY